ncbi:recombinase family protein [Microvirga ossetica]|uniref:recombinase family protein n=1 Tax=Microvirga ossetica TaxID=1882682 RepID=UPI000C156D79|nr:recombinase family protein [Microvirga ossetica]
MHWNPSPTGSRSLYGHQPPTGSKELAIEYLRFSDAIQSLGDSKRRQRDANAAYADQAHLEIVESFEDLGISAFKGRNAKVGAFKALNDMATQGIFQQHGIKHVIVEAFDRLSRMTLDDAYQQFRTLILSGMTVHIRVLRTAYDKDALNDPQKLMGALMFMGLAHADSAQKAFRVGERRKQNRIDAREGRKAMTSVCPYWLHKSQQPYEQDGRTYWFKPYPKRAQVVRDIYEMTADGMTVFSLCRTLTEREEPTFRQGKGSAKHGWSTAYISRILNSREVIGEMQPCKLDSGKPVPDGDPIYNYYPPVVEVELYNRAQAARRRPNHKGRTGTSNDGTSNYTNLFRGLLLCGHCHDAETGEAATMQIRGNLRKGKGNRKPKTYSYLICAAKRKAGSNVHETQRNWRYDLFEKLFLEHVRDFDVTGLLKNKAPESPEQIIRKQIEETEYKVQTLEAEIENLGKQLDNAKSERTGAFIQDRVDKKLAELDAAEADLKKLQEEFRTSRIREDRRVQSIETIEAIKGELAQAEGADLARLRERLAFNIKSMVDGIYFYADGAVDVIVFGGIKAYRFRDGKLEAQINLIPQIEAGNIRAEAYTSDGKDHRDAQNRTVIVEDTERRKKFEKLKRLQ